MFGRCGTLLRVKDEDRDDDELYNEELKKGEPDPWVVRRVVDVRGNWRSLHLPDVAP